MDRAPPRRGASRSTGAGIPAGPPVGAITRAFAALGKDITVLDFTDEQIAKANGGLTLWTRFVIPANTYPGQDKPINTIAQPNFLAVRDDVDEEAVYKIVKTIYENLPFLQNIHKATKAMKLESAIAGLPVPLHPGAARYYREQGIEIPDSLIANHKATKSMKLENTIAGLPVSLDSGAAR